MSLTSASKFRDQVNSDPALQARVRESVRPDQAFDVTALGASLGYRFNRAEAEQAFGGTRGDELTDFELEMVQSATPVNCNGGTGAPQ